MATAIDTRTARSLWRAVTRLDKSKINTWIAFRNSLAVALPLGIGLSLGDASAGVAVSVGALNVSYSDDVDPYPQRARRMLAWSFLNAVAVFTGSVTGQYNWAAILVVAIWAFGAGMVVSISTRAGDLGLITLIALIVFAARGALSPQGALIAAGLVLAGGLIQTACALIPWPVHSLPPERTAIGRAYLDLAKDVDPRTGDVSTIQVTPFSPQIQDTLDALGRDHSIEGDRYRLLFDQADRIRMSIFVLHRLRNSLTHEERSYAPVQSDITTAIDHLIELSADLLAAVGRALSDGTSMSEASDLLGKVQEVTKAIEARSSNSSEIEATEIPSALETLVGQLRAVLELARHTTSEGLIEFARRELSRPWRLQIRGWLGTLRANFDLHSAACRHAIRLTACVAIADAIGRAIDWNRSYWIPMTVAVVLKPDFSTTFSRGVLRLAGTFFGLLIATALYLALPLSALTQFLLVGAFTFFLRSLGPANYGVLSIAISGLIVFLVAATGVPPREVVAERGLNTVAGGLLALIAYAVWPTWERTQVSEMLAGMLDACRAYFHIVIQRFGSNDVSITAKLNETRQAWRRALSNAEASVDRVSAEPGTDPQKLNCLTSILASSGALAYSVMALEAGLADLEPHAPSDVLEKFANDVELTLYFLAAVLRGSTAASGILPKLRDDHRRLVQARSLFSPADEFVLIETDRLTVSLNTLREQVMRYVGQMHQPAFAMR